MSGPPWTIARSPTSIGIGIGIGVGVGVGTASSILQSEFGLLLDSRARASNSLPRQHFLTIKIEFSSDKLIVPLCSSAAYICGSHVHAAFASFASGSSSGVSRHQAFRIHLGFNASVRTTTGRGGFPARRGQRRDRLWQ